MTPEDLEDRFDIDPLLEPWGWERVLEDDFDYWDDDRE